MVEVVRHDSAEPLNLPSPLAIEHEVSHWLELTATVLDLLRRSRAEQLEDGPLGPVRSLVEVEAVPASPLAELAK